MANAVVETNEHSIEVEHHHHEGTGSGPERLLQFLHDTRDEMRKVTTPTRAEVQSTTIVVVVAVFLFAAYFELVDLVVGKGIDQLFLHLTKH
jgi:preprotein translocase subunit SecE